MAAWVPLALALVQLLIMVILAEKAEALGKKFRKALEDLKSPLITKVCGNGLLNAIVIVSPPDHPNLAYHILPPPQKHGLLAKPSHQHIIRLAPPLCITDEELQEGVQIIARALEEVQTVRVKDIPGVDL
ncbi:ornithine aminotransferase [Borealophlyctis nickersoniae]|nr:ornithine aminotransferase [Borealophlyctis nickersoniae]